MNLESVEEKCVKYLSQVQRPLVALDVLFRYLQRDGECADLTEAALADFLRAHELFHAIDSEVERQPFVILRSRIPGRAQLAENIQENLDTMVDALRKALNDARERSDLQAFAKVKELLARAEKLRDEAYDSLE